MRPLTKFLENGGLEIIIKLLQCKTNTKIQNERFTNLGSILGEPTSKGPGTRTNLLVLIIFL